MGAAAAAIHTAMPSNVSPLRARSALHSVSHNAPTCSTCKSRGDCLSIGLQADAMVGLEAIVAAPLRVAKGETLFRSGGRFTGLYAIRLGSFKTVLLTDDGSEQVAGYHMPGEILGADGIAIGLHDSEAVALEDSEVCAISFERLQTLARDQEAIQQNLHRVLAREIGREHKIMMMLGTMSAEQRLAAFLVDLSERYRARGYSSSEFVLRMTREEIGSYLGLKLETVSRLLSRFQREGLLQVQGRVVKLLDLITLKQVVTSGS
jgi:CRP/FNR family transcriptional regulator, anaerobic regulatory protein